MFIREVVSYGVAWPTVLQRHGDQLRDVEAALAELTPENIERAAVPKRYGPAAQEGMTPMKLLGCWEAAITSRGWKVPKLVDPEPLRILRRLGHTKDRVSVTLERHPESLNRWLYTTSPMAVRGGYVDIPIALAPLVATERQLFDSPVYVRKGFEITRSELTALSPLPHGYPFVMLGIALKPGSLDVVELQSEAGLTGRQVVVDRCLEFPAAYHQAGLGILSYFGTVLREKYPGHSAKVRIEQEDLKVRLIVESENGDREIIEKALEEYELVVRGEAAPESLFDSGAKVLELKNELRIAQLRIESQRDLLAFQSQEISTLRQLIGHALSAPATQPLTITVNPTINVNASSTSNAAIEADVSILSDCLHDLTETASADPAMHLRLLDLEESVRALSSKKTPEGIKESGGLQKLKRFLDEATDVGSSVGRFIRKVGGGFEILQKLAKKYNDIAALCGAPQVPSILLGVSK